MLLKAILGNVTALITQPMVAQQGGMGVRANGPGQNRQQNPSEVPLPNQVESDDVPPEEVEAMRSREITAKAVSGILLILLKWFKISRMCA